MKINTKTIILIFLIFRGTSWGDEPSPWDIQAQQEKTLRTQGWMIPHKANYFFPYSYNTVPHSTSINRAQHQEAKYQFSLKILVSDNLFRSRANMFFGYTQLALWQLYDRDNSAPFRDINHEPEIFLSFDQANDLGFAILRKVDFGVSHQSNGTTYPDSRSWNRAYARLVLDRKNFSFALKPWIRIKVESNNDNPDIYKYLGYGELVCSYFLKNHLVAVMLRNNLRTDNNRGALEIDYSFPLSRHLTGLVQYFTGYGESLIDYNRPNNRISIGLALSDWRLRRG